MTRRATLLFLTLTALAAGPFLFLENPPLQDYPNTLARAAVIRDLDEPDLPYREDFTLVIRPIPDIATDVLVPPLARLVGIELAGRIFLALAVALLPLGALALFHAFAPDGRLAPLAFWMLPFAHNWYVAMGFLNFILGLGLSLFALSLWVRFARRWTAGRFVLFAIAALVVYFVHLFALGALGLAVGALALAERRGWGRRFLDVAGFIPCLVLFAVFRTREGLEALDVSYEDYWEKVRLFLNCLVTYSWWEGVPVTAALVIGWLVLRRGGDVRPGRRGGALVLAFGTAYLALPKMLFGVFYTDERILVYLALAVLLAWPLPERRRRAGIVLACVIAVAALGLSVRQLVKFDREIGSETALMERLEPGGRLLPVDHRPLEGRVDVWHHVGCWYTVRRGGTTAYLFATPGKHALRWRRTLAGPDEYFMCDGRDEPLDLREIAREFDYVWRMGSGAPGNDELLPVAERIGVRGDLEVWRLKDRDR